MSKLESISFKIEGSWLQSAYYVYVARIVYKNKTYLYIGQTGDNNYHTARAPFYRISGHFAKGTSTENQIVKYFKSKILKDSQVNNEKLETAMCKSNIEYTFWKVAAFDYSKKKTHAFNRRKTQVLEHWLIFHLQSKKKITVLNASVKNEVSASKMKLFNEELEYFYLIGKQILTELGYE